ncbi:MAG TPA: winged helix-turn-helix transcriptional regulator [Candidatus Wunengus sp. YC60]|uniref:winged helix-turn-helix transcriptional regulator n=1 Tax=Candidatus Wunengus sp. YC60 TaxID=3367697 RepID=UPI004027CF0E
MLLQVEFNKYCIEKGVDRHLAHFLIFKKLFKNSTINNYTSYRLSKLSGVSRSNVEKYVAFFIAEKWCILYDNGYLYFKPVRDIMNEKGIKGSQRVKFDDVRSVKDTLDIIRLSEMKMKYEKRRRLQDVGELIESSKRLSREWCKGVAAAIGIKKRTGHCAITRSIASEVYSVSQQTIAKRINKSISTASRLIKRAEESGILTVKRTELTRCDTYEEKEALKFSDDGIAFFSWFKNERWMGDYAAIRNQYVF